MTDNVDDFLAHYGVKGMKWGQRRATRVQERKDNAKIAIDAGYTKKKRALDASNIGAKGVYRVDKRIARGEDIRKARTKEYASSTARGVAVGAAILAVAYGPALANAGAAGLSKNINAKRGAEAARKLFADNKGLTSYSTVALAFDKATGTFR